MRIGEGTYGEVFSSNGLAIKKFSKLSHLIQEYMALRYLDDCDYVVHYRDVDFANLELHMDLYDCSLRRWLENRSDHHYTHDQIMKIIYDILRGLIELHDRNLAHGDLKPSNVLIIKKPLKAVLGDCGFVSIVKYAKVARTAPVYRDPVVHNNCNHDIFSFGICFLELVANIKINKQATYNQLTKIVTEHVNNPIHNKILLKSLHEDKSKRPTARALLHLLFKESPSTWSPPEMEIGTRSGSSSERIFISVTKEDRKYIQEVMEKQCHDYHINRGKKGYGALLTYLHHHQIKTSLYKVHISVTLMILSSIFGKSGFRESDALNLCENRYKILTVHTILGNLLSDRYFMNILLRPE